MIRSSLSFVASLVRVVVTLAFALTAYTAHRCAFSIGRDDVSVFPATVVGDIATAGALRARVFGDTVLG